MRLYRRNLKLIINFTLVPDATLKMKTKLLALHIFSLIDGRQAGPYPEIDLEYTALAQAIRVTNSAFLSFFFRYGVPARETQHGGPAVCGGGPESEMKCQTRRSWVRFPRPAEVGRFFIRGGNSNGFFF